MSSTILNPTSEIANLLKRLDGAKRSGAGWRARCPNGDHHNATLSITASRDGGPPLLHCFAGCSYSQIIAAIEDRRRTPAKRSPRRSTWAPKPVAKPRITVAALAEARKLPIEFLRSLGLRDLPFKTGIEIPYRDEQGNLLLLKRRLYLDLTDDEERAGLVKFRWPWGKPSMAYGLQFLKLARRTKRLVLVEGESDCWTMWLHGIPAFGVPGADAVRVLEAQHLRGIKKLLVVQEIGKGGAHFKSNLAKQLRAIGFKGDASVFEMAPTGAKDVSDLYLLHPPKNFKGWFSRWLK
jgi:hypothetical protein